MKTKFFKKNKNGEAPTGDVARETLYLFLSGFVVLFISLFIYRVQSSVASQKDDGSIANFNGLYKNTKELLESTLNRDYIIDEYYISKDYILVGFDTGWDESKDIIPRIFGGTKVYKPFKCGNQACLCIYKEKLPAESAKRDEGVASCETEAFSNKNIVFLSEGGDIKPKTAGIARTDRKGNYLVISGSEWNAQEVYIEKFSDAGKIYIYISKIDTKKNDDPPSKRKSEIDAARKNSQVP